MGTHPIFESDFDCLTECQHIIQRKFNKCHQSAIWGFLPYVEIQKDLHHRFKKRISSISKQTFSSNHFLLRMMLIVFLFTSLYGFKNVLKSFKRLSHATTDGRVSTARVFKISPSQAIHPFPSTHIFINQDHLKKPKK